MAGYTFRYKDNPGHTRMKFFKEQSEVERFLLDNPNMELEPEREKKPFDRDDMPLLVSDRMIVKKQLNGDFKDLMKGIKKGAGKKAEMKEW